MLDPQQHSKPHALGWGGCSTLGFGGSLLWVHSVVAELLLLGAELLGPQVPSEQPRMVLGLMGSSQARTRQEGCREEGASAPMRQMTVGKVWHPIQNARHQLQFKGSGLKNSVPQRH